MAAGTAVVYVHGLWFRGHEAFLLGRRVVARHDWRWHRFAYHLRGPGIDGIADALHRFACGLGAGRVHLVGHSLGGLVILRCLARHPGLPPGRVVLLGPPCLGSQAARVAARLRIGRAFIGPVALPELLQPSVTRWLQPRELGIIAGSNPIGVARVLYTSSEPNDGVVAVSETKLPGATAHRVLRVSHSGMLLSSRVARMTEHFLDHGRFDD
jgi:pimeloyl-ACP methyl ester carboxylesterase